MMFVKSHLPDKDVPEGTCVSAGQTGCVSSLPCWAAQALQALGQAECRLRRLQEQQGSEVEAVDRGLERALLGARREEQRLLERVEQDHRDTQRRLEQLQRENAAAARVAQALVDQRLRQLSHLQGQIRGLSSCPCPAEQDQLLRRVSDLLTPWEVALSLKRVAFSPRAKPKPLTFGEIQVQELSLSFPVGACGGQSRPCPVHAAQGPNVCPGESAAAAVPGQHVSSPMSTGSARVIHKIRLSSQHEEDSAEEFAQRFQGFIPGKEPTQERETKPLHLEGQCKDAFQPIPASVGDLEGKELWGDSRRGRQCCSRGSSHYQCGCGSSPKIRHHATLRTISCPEGTNAGQRTGQVVRKGRASSPADSIDWSCCSGQRSMSPTITSLHWSLAVGRVQRSLSNPESKATTCTAPAADSPVFHSSVSLPKPPLEPAREGGHADPEAPRSLLRQFGKQGSGRADFTLPSGVHVTAQGLLFVVDCGNSRVQVLDSRGNVLQQVLCSGWQGSSPRCRHYFDVAVNGKGLIALSCAAERALLVFSRHGRLLNTFGGAGMRAKDDLEAPRGVTVDHVDRFLVVDTRRGTLSALTLEPGTGSLLKRAVLPGFHRPYLVAAHLSSGLLVVSERGDQPTHMSCVKVLDPEWNLVRTLGMCSSMGPLLTCPWGVCIDDDGSVLVADWGSAHRVLCYPAHGFGHVVVSQGLRNPRGLALMPEGHLVVADSMHHCIKLFQYKTDMGQISA